MMVTKEKRVYYAPECLVVSMSESAYLMQTSFPGQHKKANKATGPVGADLEEDENFIDGE